MLLDDSDIVGSQPTGKKAGPPQHAAAQVPISADDLPMGGAHQPMMMGDDPYAMEEPPRGATMSIGGTTYAVSLFWQPLQKTDRPINEVRETAQGIDESVDLYCLRSGNAPQYGLGMTGEGHRPGMPVAAAAIADALVDETSFVAVFTVPEGWWFIAVRNDLILSEEDVLYLEEEDARRAFEAMLAVPDWGRRIAPVEWGLDGTEEIPLDQILDNTRPAKLQRLNAAGQLKAMGVALAMFAVVTVAGYWAITFLYDTFFKSEQSQVLQQIVQPIRRAPPPPPPWDNIVSPEDLITRCQTGMERMAVPTPGWKLESMSCQGDWATASWRREFGTIGWLERALEAPGGSLVRLGPDETGNVVYGNVSIGPVETFSSEPTFTQREIRSEFTEIFQAIGGDFTLASADEAARRNRESDETSEHPAVVFEFTSPLGPDIWTAVFVRFSGLELTNVTWDSGSRQWLYQGRIFEKGAADAST